MAVTSRRVESPLVILDPIFFEASHDPQVSFCYTKFSWRCLFDVSLSDGRNISDVDERFTKLKKIQNVRRNESIDLCYL